MSSQIITGIKRYEQHNKIYFNSTADNNKVYRMIHFVGAGIT